MSLVNRPPDTLMNAAYPAQFSRKRRNSTQPDQLQCESKRLRPSPEFWDNLSKVWLTKEALKELDRRNCASPTGETRPHRTQSSRRPVTRRLQSALKSRCQTIAPDPQRNLTPEQIRDVRRLSRHGGPNLSDLRNSPNSGTLLYEAMSPSSSRSRSRKRRARSPISTGTKNTKTTKSSSTTAYNRNFQQHLIDHGIYHDGYEYPDGRLPDMPSNLDAINERLSRPRASLSPSRFPESEFRKFKRADTLVSNETPVIRFLMPYIDGDIGDPKCVGEDNVFGNLEPLTDGTLASAKPDYFFGARPEQLNRQIRDELSGSIIPSKQADLPMTPNFFLEVKGPDGSLAVATRQACYNGALGARGIHSLQSYKQDGQPIFNNNAYTITSIYHGGQLRLYSTHPIAPKDNDGNPEYVMTQLKGWCMISDSDTFRKGAAAYRNARDWAKEQRDEAIKAANERYARSLNGPSPSTPTSSEVMSKSDTSPVPDDTDTCDT